MQLMKALMDHAFDNPPPMLKTLAATAGMPAAKAHRYLVSLVRSGLVERDPVAGRYQLGPMARQMGLRAIQSLDVVRLGNLRLPGICADLGFSVALAIWTGGGPTIIAVEEARRPITIGTRVGEMMPILASATGQVFGAWLSPATTASLVEADLAAGRGTAVGATTRAEVENLLETVRATGVGSTVGGLNRTVNALSAPVFDHRGTLVAALSSLGPADEFDADRRGPLAARLKSAAAAVSGELGFVEAVRTPPAAWDAGR
jgi:DNA-binding IclR family transcriptional regulator